MARPLQRSLPNCCGWGSATSCRRLNPADKPGTRTLLRQVTQRTGEGAKKKPLPRKLTPGTRLLRDWRGVGHTVIVLEDGVEYDGKHWKSLTAIAKAITGNQWNGPLFFGLAERKQKP